jgi:transcriptional regulator with XRE-family HTH domain
VSIAPRRRAVRHLRTTRGLSQRQLAQAAGTSQQQIQRIETGHQSVRFDLATCIADALHASLTNVFPQVDLNLDHTLFAHFLFEPPNRTVAMDEGDPLTGVRIVFAGEGGFQTFEVDTDDPEPQDDDEFDQGQLRNLLVELEMSTESDHVVSFMDIDAEAAFIRASDIAVMEVPLWALYPNQPRLARRGTAPSEIKIHSPRGPRSRSTHQPT